MTFAGTITSIATEPVSSSSGTSSTVDYAVTFRLAGVPAAVKSGMSGTLVGDDRQTKQRARRTDERRHRQLAHVRVMVHGKPVYRQVATGMATSSLTQITSGLAAGEVVMTGTYSPTATASRRAARAARQSAQQPQRRRVVALPSGGGAPPNVAANDRRRRVAAHGLRQPARQPAAGGADHPGHRHRRRGGRRSRRRSAAVRRARSRAASTPSAPTRSRSRRAASRRMPRPSRPAT